MISLGVSILWIFIFLFLFWRRLKEDYSSQVIFSSALYILAGLALGYLLTKRFFPGWFFWGEFFGSLTGVVLSFLKFKMRFYETFEAATVSLFPAIVILFMSDSAANSSIVSFIAFVAVLFFIFVYFLLDANYRKFTWYKSGKTGFSGLATLGIFFLTRSVVAIFFTGVLSFVGKSEAVISGILAFICFLLIYNLGRI